MFLFRCALPLPLSVFFRDTPTTEIYTLSLHDALPICFQRHRDEQAVDRLEEPRLGDVDRLRGRRAGVLQERDRKSTRLNSSHTVISYAVFCLKKKRSRI